MSKKKIVYDNSLIDRVRQANDAYRTYLAPQANVEEYMHQMEYPSYMDTPEDYGIAEHIGNAYANWQLNRNQVIKDSALGDYVMDDDDYNTVLGVRDYLQSVREINGVLPALKENPNDPELQKKVQNLSAVLNNSKGNYDKLLSDGLNDSSLNTILKADVQSGKWDSAMSEIERQTVEQINSKTGGYSDPTTLYSRKSNALFNAQIAQSNIDEADSKITSQYYKSKMEQPGMDLTDIDTYLYKVPGLLGSSAATLTTDILTTSGTWGAYAMSGSIGGPIGTAIGIGVGAAINIAGNLYSRDKESKAEVYQNYKQSVLNKAEKKGILVDALNEAKREMAESEMYTKEQINNDDFVYDRILTGDVNINNVKLDKICINNLNGLKSLYTDNMALSVSDITQTALEVVPIGAIAKKVKGLNTLTKKAEKLGGISEKLGKRIDEVTAYGIEAVDKLPKLTKRKAIRDLGGRILITSALEGAEEGVQYIKGQRYVDNEFDKDPNIVKSWVNNLGTGARSIFAAITPWDPVYSDDQEFMENFKGGALLGGLMTSVVGGASTYAQTNSQISTDKLLSSMYAEGLDQKDRVRKNIKYADMAKSGKWDNLTASFDNLEQMNIEGLSREDIQAERRKAEDIKNLITSPTMQSMAAAIGIDPRSEDYNTFVALYDHHDLLLTEASKNRATLNSEMENIKYSPEITEHIQSIKPDATIDEEAVIRQAIFDKVKLEQYDQLINDFNNQGKKLAELEDNTGIRTSKSDVIKFKHTLEKDRKGIQQGYDNIKSQLEELGVDTDKLEVPKLHQTIKDITQKLTVSDLDVARATAERQIMRNSAEGIKAKINKYNEAEDKGEAFVQALDDIDSGKDVKQNIVEGEEVSPSNTVEPAPVEEAKPELVAEPIKEDKTIVEARDKAKQNKEWFFVEERDSRGNTKQVLNTENEYGKAYKDASTAIKDMYLTEHPKVKNYNEYVAASTMDREDDKGQRWHELYDLRNQLEEEVYTNGSSQRAVDLVYQIKQTINKPIEQENEEELRNAYNDFISSGEWQISQKVQQRIGKDRLDQIKQQAEEERQRIAEAEQERIQRQQREALPVQSPVVPTSQSDVTPIAPEVDTEKTEPAKVDELPSLGDILGGWLGQEATQAMNQTDIVPAQVQVEQDQVTEPIQQQEALTYDPNVDPYSHELNYRLTRSAQDAQGKWYREPVSFQGKEKYLNNKEFSKVSANPDFVSEVMANSVRFEVSTYTDPKTNNTSDAIYTIFNYKGKEYIATVKKVDGLYARGNHGFNRLEQKDKEVIVNNLTRLRNKIIELDKQVQKNPNLQIVPTVLKTTPGSIVNEKNEDGTPKNRNIIDSAWQPVKDPYKITPANTEVGVTTGALGDEKIRIQDRVVSSKGSPLGKPAWLFKVNRPDGTQITKIALLNYKTFKDSPKVAKLILDLLLSNQQFYTDAKGTVTNIQPHKLLSFLVNIGSHTAVDPNNSKLSADQIKAKLAKQFYIDDNSNIVIGNTTYSVSDLLTNEAIKNQALEYIQNNFHWNLDEDGLNKNYLGGDFQSQVVDPHFESVRSFLKTSNVDNIVLIPGELEFGLKDFGLKKVGDRKESDESNPNGISVLGWYIKQGILLTDISDNLEDANIYVDDVMLVDKTVEQNQQEAVQKVQKAVEEDRIRTQVFTLPDETGKQITIDMADIFSILDGKNRKGPNMEVLSKEDPNLLQNQDKMNASQASAWLSSTLGITPEIVPSVIEVTEAGNSVVGRVTEDSILLSEEAPIGTEYHEAWHRVSQLLINDKRRNRIFDRYKKSNPELNDKQIDEMLAEDFREFMLDDSANYAFDTKNWFRRILDFIKLWARTGQYGLARLYSDINRGKFAGIKPSQSNTDRFRSIYGDKGPNLEVYGYQFKNIQQYGQFDNIVKSLTYAFFQTSFTEGKTIDYSDLAKEKPRFDTLKLILQAQASRYPSKVMDEIVERFDDVFAPTIASRLKSLGIRAIDSNEADTMANIEEGTEGVNIGQHTVEGMNISIKDNAPAEVKFFFQTVPHYEVGQDGTSQASFDPITHFPKFVDSNTAWNNVLKDLAGCRTISNIIDKVATYAQSNNPFYQALLVRLTQLVQQSNQKEDMNLATKAEADLTKIETVLTSDINKYKTVKVSEDKESGFVSHSLIDNTVDTKALTYPKVWSQALFTNSGIFKYDKEGNIIAEDGAKRNIEVLINNFNRIKSAFLNNRGILKVGEKNIDLHLAANQNALKAMLVKLMNTAGIGIDKPTIDTMLLSGDYGNPKSDNYTLLNSFVVNTTNYGGLSKVVSVLSAIKDAIGNDGKLGQVKINDKVTSPTQMWNEVGFVKELANYYAYTHATDNSLSSYGPDGNTYYMVSQNNFAKDRLHELVNDKEVFNQLDAVQYNKHSILLNAVRNGNKNLEIETLINFKDTTSGDQGRDYFGITDREDYIAKMTAVFNDRIIFPTVADKKTYHFISGVKLPHERIQFTMMENGKMAVKYGDNALDIIIGYCYDELNQVELALRQTDDDPTHYNEETGIHYNEDGSVNDDWLEPRRRINNFHTPNKYKDKTGTHTIEGNGSRFLFLTGIHTDKGFVSFNDPKKSAKENLQNAKDYFFNLTTETQKSFISGILNRRVMEEIKTAKSLGIITANDSNSIWSLRNELLDDNVLSERQGFYNSIDSSNSEGYAILDMLADYVINSIISINEVEKLFSGAPAYYKVQYDENGIVDASIDKIKRLGSLTSTGLNNRLDFFNDPIRDEYTVAELKDHEIMDKQYYELEGLFTRGNIKETIQELEGEEAWNDVKDMSIQEIEKVYPDSVKMAKAAAKVEVAGYKEGINVADAAVYISPNMTRDLLRMRGVWSPEIKQAFEILSNPETADKWDSDPTLYAQANKVILNAMKYVAFGTRLNEVPGLGIPYFNKMALFPLFKSIATGDIKAVYDRMTHEGNELDMVMFDSAVKAGSRSPMKAYRAAEDSEIELKDGQIVLSASITDQLESGEGNTLNDFNNLVTYKQKFKYIRQQLETNPHTHEEQMAGTQFMKVNLSNLRMGDMYGKEGSQVSGQEIKDTVMNALNKLSDMGKKNLQDELFTRDGNVNITKLGKMLEKDARESDANDNIVSGLKTKDDAFVMPLSALSDNKWLESRFISMINKEVVDVHMPGGAFIQRSAFGLEATSQNVITEDMINDGKPLLMINSKDGSMDSVVSINLLKHIIPNYSKLTFKQARQWLIDKNIIGQNAEANAIGYRIPTQSVASISALRFVDVFPEIMGDTIMLPEGFTKLTGSDFDIDKLYVARYAYNKGGGIIRHDALKYKDVQSAYKNDILSFYLKVLLTRDNTSSLKLSIDNATENVKSVLKDIESGRSKQHMQPFEVYTPSYQEARKSEYTGGKAGIGPFALNNAHHILTQLTKLNIVENEFTTALNITELGRIFDYPTTGTAKGGRILDWLSAMINGFVDIAKDPYITRLNVNSWTYNMVAFLLRTGKGKQTFYFMSQPILKEMAEEVLKTKGKYGIDRTKTPSQLEREAIEKVLDKYDPNKKYRKEYQYINSKKELMAKEYKDLFSTMLNEKGEETSRARELLLEPGQVKDFDKEQVRMYYAYLAIKPYADSLANLVKYSKIDTKKTGKSFAEQQTYYNGMIDMANDPSFPYGAVNRFYNETFIQKKTDNSIPFGTSIFSNLLLRNTDQFIRNKDIALSLLGRKNNADAKLLNATISGMEAQLKSDFFIQYAKDNNIDLSTMFKGQNSIANRLNRFKLEILKGNPKLSHLLSSNGTIANDFVNYLIPNINKDSLDFIDKSEQLSPDQALANNLINYWRELIDDPNPQVSKLFKDIAVYAFFTSGDNTVMNSFFQYLPNSFRKEIGYDTYIQGEMDKLINSSSYKYSGKDDLFLNSWSNDKLVRPVDMYGGFDKAPLRAIYLNENTTMPNIVMGQRTDMKDPVIRPISWISVINDEGKVNKYPLFQPYIKIKDSLGFDTANWHVYTLIGYVENPEVSDTGRNTGRIVYTPMYGLVSKKGYKSKGHTVVEYGVPTQFDFNRENEWNYAEALNNKEALADMAGEFERDNWQADIDKMHHISELPSYQNSNYLTAQQSRFYEEDADPSDESEQGIPLQEAGEEVNQEQTGTRTYSGMITELAPNEVFVFGSNTQGRHGKGAALTAKNKFGAVYGQAEGRQGQSYAIITKDLTKSTHPSRTKEQIIEQITTLYNYARQNPDLDFVVAYSGIGSNLNAYSNTEMAQMFSSQDIPNNIIFEENFNQLMKSQATQLDLSGSKPLTGIDLMGLYEEGNRQVSSLLDELELTKEERQEYLNEFTKQMSQDNVTTLDQLEEAIRKFMCNL